LSSELGNKRKESSQSPTNVATDGEAIVCEYNYNQIQVTMRHVALGICDSGPYQPWALTGRRSPRNSPTTSNTPIPMPEIELEKLGLR